MKMCSLADTFRLDSLKCPHFFPYRSALEELNVRSNLALSQKRFVNELEGDAEELEQEFLKMTAQVVS